MSETLDGCKQKTFVDMEVEGTFRKPSSGPKGLGLQISKDANKYKHCLWYRESIV